ncbi:MAG: hypothetical protein IPJ40_01055 [Saprospirales bacterium]|nr:hypothetical protein [Saprospirales bacterium]
MIQVREINDIRKIKPFIDFPYRLYKNCPYWIPPLKRGEVRHFTPAKNPSFEHAEAKLWVAEKKGKVVGRIVGIINDLETQARGEVHGRFGWLEFEEDIAIPRALLETAERWAKAKGAVLFKGPVGFTNLDPSGMTVEGFEELGTISGAFHYPYYGKFMDQLGFEKLADWLELVLDKAPDEVPEKMQRLQPILEKKFGIQNFQINSKKLREKDSRILFFW